MKTNLKISVIFTTIIAGTLLIYSCSNDKESDKKNGSFASRDQLMNVAGRHSDGLRYCLNKYNTEFALSNNQFMSKEGDIDTLAVFKFFEAQTKAYIGNNPISYNNISLGLDYYSESSDSLKLQEIHKMLDTSEFKEGTAVMKSYYAQIKEIIGNKDYDVTTTNRELDKLFVKSQTEISNDNDKRVAQVMIGVASDSNEFWSHQYDENGNQLNKWDTGTVLADIAGAGDGALWGSAAAGPLGGILMAVSFACIDSGVAHAISHAHIGHH
jgi:hypothetical protein